MKRSKKYIAAAAKVKQDHLYTPLEAVTLAKETSVTKYDSTIEVAHSFLVLIQRKPTRQFAEQ